MDRGMEGEVIREKLGEVQKQVAVILSEGRRAAHADVKDSSDPDLDKYGLDHYWAQQFGLSHKLLQDILGFQLNNDLLPYVV
jgi:hypothetical protein